MPSMSARARSTRAQVTRIAEEDVRLMAAQLEHWRTQLDAHIAKVAALGADSGTSRHEAMEALKTKYEAAHARFDELKTAGDGNWERFKPSIERAWNDLEDAFEKCAS